MNTEETTSDIDPTAPAEGIATATAPKPKRSKSAGANAALDAAHKQVEAARKAWDKARAHKAETVAALQAHVAESPNGGINRRTSPVIARGLELRALDKRADTALGEAARGLDTAIQAEAVASGDPDARTADFELTSIEVEQDLAEAKRHEDAMLAARARAAARIQAAGAAVERIATARADLPRPVRPPPIGGVGETRDPRVALETWRTYRTADKSSELLRLATQLEGEARDLWADIEQERIDAELDAAAARAAAQAADRAAAARAEAQEAERAARRKETQEQAAQKEKLAKAARDRELALQTQPPVEVA